tara:strand:+ start:5728 stop:6417 length:690 start_codon:yes stop_codon:yes gene_type:complete
MKNIGLSLFLALFGISIPYAQSSCSDYYALNEGVRFEYTNYDKKGKPEGTMDYVVTDVTDNGNETKASMAISVKDDKGEELYTSDYNFTCSGDVVKIDFESLVSSQMMQQYQDLEMDISGTDIELPNDLSVGQELPDANMAMKINMSGMNMNINVDMKNRKVEKKETVTTPAGTFDCFVIYSESETKMLMKQTFPSRQWLAEGVGLVKQESYNKGGKLVGSMQLTQFSK